MSYGGKAPCISNQGQIYAHPHLLVYLNSLDKRLPNPQKRSGCRGEQKHPNTQVANNISTICWVTRDHSPTVNNRLMFVSFSLSLLEMKIF
jgi:hypothetical protein